MLYVTDRCHQRNCANVRESHGVRRPLADDNCCRLRVDAGLTEEPFDAFPRSMDGTFIRFFRRVASIS